MREFLNFKCLTVHSCLRQRHFWGIQPSIPSWASLTNAAFAINASLHLYFTRHKGTNFHHSEAHLYIKTNFGCKSFTLVTLENHRALVSSRSHLHNSFPFFFNRMVYLVTTVASIPEYHRSAGSSSPISHLLDLLLSFLRPAIPRLFLSVTHYLLHSSTIYLPTELVPKIIFLMGKRKPKQLEALRKKKGDQAKGPAESSVSDAYLDWRTALFAKHISHLRKAYAIPDEVSIRIPDNNKGATLSGYNHKVVVYEVMFKVGLSLSLPPMVCKLLTELNLAPIQIKPNGWVLLVSFCILWKMAMGLGKHSSVREFLAFYK